MHLLIMKFRLLDDCFEIKNKSKSINQYRRIFLKQDEQLIQKMTFGVEVV
jgi:hypothetical protein